mmetsp:Transcript_20530/g.32119  ORF Transcript_20530/g.32119 Transcript_20530/m.32119 type:complete len:106 (+) Transcript_20530:83-400(+)|eukprot:CAMPEP_0184298868 /NCGR_PEP_ID=MMETSP1049-20130417/9594_1 /TAXON_ID=77928 /ORGANISM="Proteomonas sulcata, Strain CCMP704" /LENGTH=105 /DNA_ID=CAMNT_0026609131 /DNA_START=145 /DNA_END=462 /DNA_ORIENTATION=+
MPPACDPQATANFDFPASGSKDPVAAANARENKVKDVWVKIMTAREARNSLAQCYRREGVNHQEKCKDFAEAYMASIKTPFYTAGMKKYVGPEKTAGLAPPAAGH